VEAVLEADGQEADELVHVNPLDVGVGLADDLAPEQGDPEGSLDPGHGEEEFGVESAEIGVHPSLRGQDIYRHGEGRFEEVLLHQFVAEGGQALRAGFEVHPAVFGQALPALRFDEEGEVDRYQFFQKAVEEEIHHLVDGFEGEEGGGVVDEVVEGAVLVAEGA
jgi:hypothetical protein